MWVREESTVIFHWKENNHSAFRWSFRLERLPSVNNRMANAALRAIRPQNQRKRFLFLQYGNDVDTSVGTRCGRKRQDIMWPLFEALNQTRYHYSVLSGHLYTLLKAGFRQRDAYHIVSNMVGLYFFGSELGKGTCYSIKNIKRKAIFF